MNLNAWLSQNGPPWYITTIIGGIVGVAITGMGPILTYPVRRFRKDQYIGKWYEYHWTWHGGAKKLWHAKLVIRRGVKSKYTVSFDHLPQMAASSSVKLSPDSQEVADSDHLKYSGDLRTERGHIILVLGGTTHQESLMYRFRDWIPSSSDRVVGLWMSYDHSGSPAAGAALLSRKELSDAEAIQFIESHFASSRGLLRIR